MSGLIKHFVARDGMPSAAHMNQLVDRLAQLEREAAALRALIQPLLNGGEHHTSILPVTINDGADTVGDPVAGYVCLAVTTETAGPSYLTVEQLDFDATGHRGVLLKSTCVPRTAYTSNVNILVGSGAGTYDSLDRPASGGLVGFEDATDDVLWIVRAEADTDHGAIAMLNHDSTVPFWYKGADATPSAFVWTGEDFQTVAASVGLFAYSAADAFHFIQGVAGDIAIHNGTKWAVFSPAGGGSGYLYFDDTGDTWGIQNP